MSSQKRSETDDITGEISSKRLRTLLIDDEEDDDDNNNEVMMSMVEESSVVEVMKTLEAEMKYSGSSSSSSSLSSIMNGYDNGERCGPSFSDSSSTVMASLDISTCCFSYLVGPTPTHLLPPTEDSLSSSSSSPNLRIIGEGGGGGGEEEKNENIGGRRNEVIEEEEDEEEWLERVLYETHIEEEFLTELSF